MRFNTLSQTDGRNGIALLISLVALAAVAVAIGTGGVAAQDQLANETVEIDNETTDVLVEIEWADDAASDATADVEATNSSLAEDAGTMDSEDYAGTLNGTTFELEDDARDDAEYQVELDTTGETVTVSASTFTDGSADLSEETETSVTSDDTVTSVELVATPTVTETVDADPGNVTETEINVSDAGLDNGAYDVDVLGTESDVEEVSISTLGGASTIIGAITGDVPTSYAVVGVLALLGAGYYSRREGWI